MIDLESEFSQYFREVNSALDDFELYKGILSNVVGNEKKINQINGFLYTILNSLKYSFVMKTAKLVDVREQKNIFKFINCCKNQKNQFLKKIVDEYYNEKTKTTERMFIKNVDVLEDIKNFELELDKYSVQIENIKAHRDMVYAHNDKKYFYNNGSINDEFKVTYNDIDEILHLIFKELNILSIDYNRRAYSKFSDTIDDYLHIIKKL